MKKIYIMTDQEGVAGVLDFENWCKPESRFNDMAREFLTLEVNAAIEGFFKGGAKEVLVADGHGSGAVNPKLLDRRAQVLRGWGRGWPGGLEEGADGVAWVGQHAKSRTECAHLAHTQGFVYYELSINGVAIGEFGQLAMCASQLGIRAIFGAGDEALTREAQELVPGIETVAVKRGTIRGTGDECETETYARRNLGAIHLQPEEARRRIRAGAERAIRRAPKDKSFGIIPLKPPFERVLILRAQGDQPRRISRETHPTDVIALMNMPFEPSPLQPKKEKGRAQK
jgi:D-amino peptidase